MKPIKSLLLAGALSLSAVSAQAVEKLKMATIAPGTSAYLTMTTFANIVNQNQDKYEFTVDATGAATKHMVEVAKGKLDYSMSAPTVIHFLKNGLAMYKKLKGHEELAKKLKLVMWFPYGQYHILTHADSGIEKLSDLKGKKVFLGPPGGGAWTAAYGLVKSATGLDAKEGDYESVKASWSSAFQGFQDRQFDVYINGGIAPFPQVEQLALTNKIRILGMTEAEYNASEGAQKFFNGLKGRELGIINKDAYGDNVLIDEDMYVLGAKVGITVNADMSDEQVYEVTKAFWENVEGARASTPWLNALTMEYAVSDGGMPLHPGAQKYYMEKGVEIAESSKAK